MQTLKNRYTDARFAVKKVFIDNQNQRKKLGIFFIFLFFLTEKNPCSRKLRWLEIVSWHAQSGPLIAHARTSTRGLRRCKFSKLVPSKILQNLYYDQKYL